MNNLVQHDPVFLLREQFKLWRRDVGREREVRVEEGRRMCICVCFRVYVYVAVGV